MDRPNGKKQEATSVREIRRSCQRELYRAQKKLKVYLTDEQIKKANQLYLAKVLINLPFIQKNRDNRKLQAEWWEENVCSEIAAIWNVDSSALAQAFYQTFAGVNKPEEKE